MGKGSQTTTNQTSTSADPQAAALYRQLLGQAQGVASTPYQGYTGELTAGINQQQQTGINNVNSAAGFAQPYIQQAAGMVQGAASPLTSQQIQQYQNPYQQQVIDATMAQAAQGNAQQQAALKGNTIANGALGGNREGVAQANLASQQSTALNSQLAGLNSQNYTQALSTAQQQFQANPLSAAYSLGNLGVSGQNAALSGAGAQIGAGTLQQQTQQASDTANYGQYQQQQAYPYQQLQWLAGLGTGVGSQLGGTSSGSTTAPPPNPWSQALGVGLTAASFFKDGGAVDGRRGFAGGGVPSMPWGNAQGWIPTMQIAAGRGAPQGSAPAAAKDQGVGDAAKQAQSMMGVASGLRNRFSSESYGGGSLFDGDESAYGGSSSHPLDGLSASDYGAGFADGGPVRGFAAGGSPSDFLELTNGDPAWASPDVGPGYAMPGVSSQTPFEARGGFGEMPAAKVDPAFLRKYQDANPEGADPRIEGAIADNVVPLPRSRPVDAPVMAADDDEPAAASAVRGFAPSASPVGMAANSNIPAPAAAAAARASGSPGVRGFADDSGEGLLFTMSPAARTGMLAAGLSMLASRSPNLGNAIGDGGLAGVGAYGNVKTAEAKQALDDRKLQQQADELAREADKAAKDLALRTSSQQETARHNKATEQKEFKPTYGVVGEYPVTGVKQYGWIDPNKQTTTAAPRVGSEGAPAGGAGGIDTKLTGSDYLSALEQRNPSFASVAKAVGDYKTPITALSQRGGMREKILDAALRYNPDFDSTQFTGKARAVSNFAGGPEGRTVRSLNVAIDHLNTLDEAAKAMQNGNLPMLNGIVNSWRTKTGSPLATNFDSIKQVVSAEIAKSVVGGQTALHDRDDMAQRANNSGSPEQLSGIISEFKKLMAGQMNGLRHQYETTTRLKNFDDFLEPAAKAELQRSSAPKGEGGGGNGGGGFTPPSGAVARKGKDGKTYYFDPATKQPYPGQ